MTIWGGDDRKGPLEHQHHIPFGGHAPGHTLPVFLDILGREGFPHKAGHLARMRGEDRVGRQALPPLADSSQGIQPISVHYKRRQRLSLDVLCRRAGQKADVPLALLTLQAQQRVDKGDRLLFPGQARSHQEGIVLVHAVHEHLYRAGSDDPHIVGQQ